MRAWHLKPLLNLRPITAFDPRSDWSLPEALVMVTNYSPAHPAHSSSACISNVFTASSCKSGG